MRPRRSVSTPACAESAPGCPADMATMEPAIGSASRWPVLRYCWRKSGGRMSSLTHQEIAEAFSRHAFGAAYGYLAGGVVWRPSKRGS